MEDHIIQKIWEDKESLTDLEKEHLKNCSKCKQEYFLATMIEESINNIPTLSFMNTKVEEILNNIFYRPIYKVWQLIMICLLLMILPITFQLNIFTILYTRNLLIFNTIFSITLFIFILFALSYHFFIYKRSKIKVISEKIDIFLLKILMKTEKKTIDR